ncbi:hypothetical protein GE21DRAFT_9469 [Neurospora crassa]|uniref:Uncharacterized protein n=1 Tax=Neurospora crassa (strain ATCC 24698 / 74-OR23-1A / CBS 708.71 / DSM 1257 / FGSC 987) TaxID=367110 RepID=Q7RXN6_NEUCR|nr:hypothetical protein NCU05135 [Neurospora crassa OR74A]EAA27397.3 hypothetical protein NCU05135 [Neurospora crassa OR74A]KHE88005.1 hypothetical protein GE21DRAFT_9469 [Neurospora crassa]|eukprot:XP_956633.3 hypothetical protein NCU05135 [Neurospora crassa OR74A]
MSTILIPLYIYPSFSSSHESSGWAPLFRALTTALTKNPSLEFLVVINPGNGPGPDYPIPNADYRAALSKLSDTTQYPNVKVIGNHPPVNTGLWQHCTITSESPIQQPGKDISYDARRAADHGYQWLLKNRRRLDTWTPPYPHLQVVRTVSPAGRSPGHALEPGTCLTQWSISADNNPLPIRSPRTNNSPVLGYYAEGRMNARTVRLEHTGVSPGVRALCGGVLMLTGLKVGGQCLSEKATEISDFPNLLFRLFFLASPLRSNPAPLQPGSVPTRLGPSPGSAPRGSWRGGSQFTLAIRLDGIFVDEVPIDAQYLDYLQRITDSVRSGFAEAAYRRSHCDSINSSENTSLSAPSSSATSSTTGLGIVIHNPGIFPSADSSDAFFSPRLVNYVVVFENCLAAWWDSGDYVNANLALLTPEKRAKAIAVAHTCGCGPKSQAGGSSGGRPQQPDLEGHHAAEAEKTEGSEKEAIKKNVQNFLDEVVTQHKLAGHFATSATDYATWCSGWEGYVEVACDLGGSNMLTGEASEEGLHG